MPGDAPGRPARWSRWAEKHWRFYCASKSIQRCLTGSFAGAFPPQPLTHNKAIAANCDIFFGLMRGTTVGARLHCGNCMHS